MGTWDQKILFGHRFDWERGSLYWVELDVRSQGNTLGRKDEVCEVDVYG